MARPKPSPASAEAAITGIPADVDPHAAQEMRGRSDGIDLLEIRGLGALIRWVGFPYVIQAALLGVFVLFLIQAWGVFAPAEVDERVFSRTFLITLVIWGVWWPAMVWGAVLLGRVWCMVCPLELLSNFVERIARRLGIGQRALPRWVEAGTVIVLLYATTHLLVIVFHIHRVPAYTAGLLLGLILLVVVTSLAFRHRAYCRGFCPVGLLLGIYGRGGIFAVRPASQSVCRGCAGAECRAAGNRDRLDARSCPSLLNPAMLDSNLDCLLCAQCIKACPPGNMRLLLRRPFSAADARTFRASLALTFFVMIDSGFVISEWAEASEFAEQVFLAAPTWVAGRLGWLAGVDWLAAAWTLVGFPLLVWCGLAGVMWLLGMRDSLVGLWRRLALPAAVVVSSLHMGRALAESISWSRFLPGALRDPGGVDTAIALGNGARAMPGALVDPLILNGIGLALLAAAVIIARREHRLASARATSS